MISRLISVFVLIVFVAACNNIQWKDEKSSSSTTEAVGKDSIIVGAAQTQLFLPYLQGKKVGLTANQSSVIGNRRSLDTLLKLGVDIIKAFGPEHGLLGAISANTFIGHQKDGVSGIPVVSLFGEYYKPTAVDLAGIDVMLFDMQDVGARFYTYISTLHYVMEACAENDIEVIVLDRPNPNDYVDGPILQEGFQSFIGMHPVPIVHGMTIGEYAQMINGEGWLNKGIKCKLKIIRMQNYVHGKPYTPPIPPSPNLNTQQSILLYPSLCWFGATAISDGRGTLFPFQVLGSPALKDQYSFSFTPMPIKGMSEKPMHMGEECYGLDLRNYNATVFQEKGQLNIQWLLELYQEYPDKDKFFNKENEKQPNVMLHFDQLAGNSTLRKQIKLGESEGKIRESWEPELSSYKQIRKKYLLYR